MIYIRGDTHGDVSCFEFAQPRLTARDHLIVAGDCGLVFRGGDHDPGEKAVLDRLERLPYRILFVDGNHEGFPYLKEYPEEFLFDAPVRRIRNNIFWLQRGYIYTIEDSTFFVMGGAYSPDKAFRQAVEEAGGGQCWFEEELPSPEEYHRAIAALQEADYEVDYVITHTAPRSIIPRVIGKYPDPHDQELTGFLDWIYHDITFKKWFFGHFHQDKQINEQMIACCDTMHLL